MAAVAGQNQPVKVEVSFANQQQSTTTTAPHYYRLPSSLGRGLDPIRDWLPTPGRQARGGRSSGQGYKLSYQHGRSGRPAASSSEAGPSVAHNAGMDAAAGPSTPSCAWPVAASVGSLGLVAHAYQQQQQPYTTIGFRAVLDVGLTPYGIGCPRQAAKRGVEGPLARVTNIGTILAGPSPPGARITSMISSGVTAASEGYMHKEARITSMTSSGATTASGGHMVDRQGQQQQQQQQQPNIQIGFQLIQAVLDVVLTHTGLAVHIKLPSME